MLNRLIASVAAVAVACAPLAAEAARVSPMIVELEPAGNASVARVELTNDAARDIPFEVRVMRGDISEDGELTLTPADDDFLVFPPQSIVQARSQQVFRLQYVGDPQLDKSAIYYMSIQQVPVKVEPEQSQVQVVVNYNVLVNVVPRGTSPEAVVESVEATVRQPEVEETPETEDETAGVQVAPPPQPGILVRVGNRGPRYFFAGMSRWKVTGVTEDGQTYSRDYRPEEMSRVVGVGVVAPDRTRAFFIPTEAPLAPDSIRVEVSP